MIHKAKIFKKAKLKKTCGNCKHLNHKQPFRLRCQYHGVGLDGLFNKCKKWALSKRGVVKALIKIKAEREAKKTKIKKIK
jgi:hypothetical protein